LKKNCYTIRKSSPRAAQRHPKKIFWTIFKRARPFWKFFGPLRNFFLATGLLWTKINSKLFLLVLFRYPDSFHIMPKIYEKSWKHHLLTRTTTHNNKVLIILTPAAKISSLLPTTTWTHLLHLVTILAETLGWQYTFFLQKRDSFFFRTRQTEDIHSKNEK